METVRKYQSPGCKLGDGAIAAHLKELGVETLITENRHFLEELKDLPFRRLSATEALYGAENLDTKHELNCGEKNQKPGYVHHGCKSGTCHDRRVDLDPGGNKGKYSPD